MPPDDASLPDHLDTLYPLACVLAGPDAADTLLRHTYERAAETPPSDRPDDTQGWLFRLLIDTKAQNTGTSRTSTDALRREAAENAVARVLPAAFASGSEKERLVLTLDALDAPLDALAEALNTSPEDAGEARSQAWSALQDRVRDGLVGSERSLAHEVLAPEHLRPALREDLTNRYPSAPASLRSVLHAIVERGASAHSASPPTSEDHSSATPRNESTSDDGSQRGVIVGGVLLLIAVGLAYGVFQFQSGPRPQPDTPDLSSLSTAAADTLQPTYETADPAAAQTFIQTTWQRRVAVPSIAQARLEGVGTLRVNDASVPGFVFSEPGGARITILAFNYALLDQLGDNIQLDTSTRESLTQNETLISQPTDGGAVVLWRHRADILVAVAPHLSPEALRGRITPGGSVR